MSSQNAPATGPKYSFQRNMSSRLIVKSPRHRAVIRAQAKAIAVTAITGECGTISQFRRHPNFPSARQKAWQSVLANQITAIPQAPALDCVIARGEVLGATPETF